MADESAKLLVDGLDPDDLALLAGQGVDVAALAREQVHVRAEQIRVEERHAYLGRLIDEVAASDEFGFATTEEIVAGIHADRRRAGWE